MNVKELIEEVENDLELVSYLNRVPKKNKKTQASYLESLNHLPIYFIWMVKRKWLRKYQIVSYKFHLKGIITLGPLLRALWFYWPIWKEKKENQVLVYKKLLLSPLEQGEESTQKIRRRVHQRFLNGDSLEQKLAKIEQAPSPESEMERRLLYLTDLLKIHLFITESTCEESDIQTKIEENMEILKKYIKEHEIYSLFPFKG